MRIQPCDNPFSSGVFGFGAISYHDFRKLKVNVFVSKSLNYLLFPHFQTVFCYESAIEILVY